jgi:SAM-dependent methyltransferase
MKSQWDKRYETNPQALEEWLYGKTSLTGATREWFLEKAAQWPEGTRLLDAGCGGGVTAYQLAQRGLLSRLDYTGLDGSGAMLALARSKVSGPARWIQEDLREVRLEQEFDRILLRAVIEHLDDPAPVLRNVSAGLKRQGELIIIFWNNPVAGEPIYSKTEMGFPDNAHSEPVLIDILRSCSLVVHKVERVGETSARGEPFRTIWLIRHAEST